MLASHSPLSSFKALLTFLWINLIQSCSECKYEWDIWNPGSTFSFSLKIPEACLRKRICLAHNHCSLFSLPGSSECLLKSSAWLLELLGFPWTILRGEGSSDFWPSFTNLVFPQGFQLCLSSGSAEQRPGPVFLTRQFLCSVRPPLAH